MVDEGKNSVFEGALVWSKSDDHDAIWKPAKVLDVGHINEANGKTDIQVEMEEDGTRAIIKTKIDDHNEYQQIKLRTATTSTTMTSKSCSSPSLHNYDLPSLPLVNEPEILERIRFCHMKNLRYLSIGPMFLFLHRYETIPSRFNPQSYRSYHLVDDLRHDIVNPLTPPHLTQLIHQIHLKISQMNLHSTSPPLSSSSPSQPSPNTPTSSSPFRSTQAIVMLGESGSGKSKCSKDICSHLSYLASTTVRKDSSSSSSSPSTYLPDLQLFESIHCILDSFGHAQTTRNPYSSRYSKAIKISYDEDTGLMKGILYRCFHLESHRVVEQATGESNYRIFYDVFDDIYFAAQAMSKYGIDNLTLFRYTSKRPTSTFQPGKSSYKDLSAALESLANLPKVKQNTSIFGLLAAILHLGELEFDVMDNYGDINTVLSTGNSISCLVTHSPHPFSCLVLPCRSCQCRSTNSCPLLVGYLN
jgi:myosin heavy subunit